MQTIFRREALDRLANPERLDAPLRLISSAHWLVLGAFAVMTVAALIWASVTFAPVRISGRGILIDRAGLAEVVASDGGQIAALRISPGVTVQRGQVVAVLARTEVDREIADTRAKLAQAEVRLGRLQAFYAEQGLNENAADGQRQSGLRRTRAELDARRRVLEERAQRIAALVPRGFVGRDTLIAAEAAAAELRERIANLDAEAGRLEVDGVGRQGRNRLALLDEQTATEQLRRELARLEAKAGDQSVVRAQSDGQVVEVKVGQGDVVAPGSALATIARGDRGGETIALVYVPAGEGRRVQPGMTAELLPDTVEKQVYGTAAGRVLSVSPLPATREGMRRILRNDNLVDQLLMSGPVTEVQVAMARDPSTPSGFRWSTSRGPERGVGVGTLTGGRIVIDRRRVLDWLLPGRE